MVTQSKGFTHGSVRRGPKKKQTAADQATAQAKPTVLAPAEIAMTQLGQQSGLFTIDCTQDCAADFTKENLQNYDIVMFYTTGVLPIADDDLDYFLNDWLKQKGHGFIGFHSATDTYKNHKPYWDMIGGSFNGHPWGSRTTVTISVHDASHPAMKPFGSQFQIKDEIYQYKNWQPEKVRVLMSLNMEKTNPKRPYHVAVSWCKEWGDGKVFVNNLGHNPGTWTNKMFLDSVIGAVKWITNDEPGNATPNPELSAAENEQAAKIAEAFEQAQAEKKTKAKDKAKNKNQ